LLRSSPAYRSRIEMELRADVVPKARVSSSWPQALLQRR